MRGGKVVEIEHAKKGFESFAESRFIRVFDFSLVEPKDNVAQRFAVLVDDDCGVAYGGDCNALDIVP